MSDYAIAQRELMLASFDLGQAQRTFEDAEQRWREALDKVERLGGIKIPKADQKT